MTSVILSGRPMLIDELDGVSNSILAAWLPGTSGGQGIVDAISALGYSDIMSNPKHGTVNIPSATSKDKGAIRMALLSLERKMGGMSKD